MPALLRGSAVIQPDQDLFGDNEFEDFGAHGLSNKGLCASDAERVCCLQSGHDQRHPLDVRPVPDGVLEPSGR